MSTDDLSKAQYVVEKVGIPFPILYDPSTEMVEDYGVYNLLNDGLAAPATFVIDKSGVIRWKYVSKSYYDRPPTDEVLSQVKMIDG